MANDVKWIKLKVGMFDGESFKRIKKAKIGGEKFRDKLTAVWFELMDFAGKCNHSGAFINSREIPYSSLEDIAIMIDRETDELELCMKFFVNEGMVEIIDDVFMLANWAEYQNMAGLDKIREGNRERQAKFRERKKLKALMESNEDNGNVTDNVTPCDSSYSYSNSSSTSESLSKEGESEGEPEPTKKPTKAEIDAFFEEIWKLYPVKKGKGSVSDSQKKKLYAIGLDEIKRAIERYLKDLEKDSWRQPQHGSTFFNSGHVDFLDKNFVPNGGEKGGRNTGDPGESQRHGTYL